MGEQGFGRSGLHELVECDEGLEHDLGMSVASSPCLPLPVVHHLPQCTAKPSLRSCRRQQAKAKANDGRLWPQMREMSNRARPRCSPARVTLPTGQHLAPAGHWQPPGGRAPEPPPCRLNPSALASTPLFPLTPLTGRAHRPWHWHHTARRHIISTYHRVTIADAHRQRARNVLQRVLVERRRDQRAVVSVQTSGIRRQSSRQAEVASGVQTSGLPAIRRSTIGIDASASNDAGDDVDIDDDSPGSTLTPSTARQHCSIRFAAHRPPNASITHFNLWRRILRLTRQLYNLVVVLFRHGLRRGSGGRGGGEVTKVKGMQKAAAVQ